MIENHYPDNIKETAKRFNIWHFYNKTAKTDPLDLDLIACWFDYGLAKTPVVVSSEDEGKPALIVRFKVLCVYDCQEIWQWRDSNPLPSSSKIEATQLLERLGIKNGKR